MIPGCIKSITMEYFETFWFLGKLQQVCWNCTQLSKGEKVSFTVSAQTPTGRRFKLSDWFRHHIGWRERSSQRCDTVYRSRCRHAATHCGRWRPWSLTRAFKYSVRTSSLFLYKALKLIFQKSMDSPEVHKSKRPASFPKSWLFKNVIFVLFTENKYWPKINDTLLKINDTLQGCHWKMIPACLFSDQSNNEKWTHPKAIVVCVLRIMVMKYKHCF